jgi:hypothetical protein
LTIQQIWNGWLLISNDEKMEDWEFYPFLEEVVTRMRALEVVHYSNDAVIDEV